ncbi:MAG: nickel pincer cofactor biosynthesis protein LarC [Deltaproteobacteria bacterium]|nr:nickel pincer cofactor biosynthesis protein LarC [Deltaproteobacteria bacterium]
MSRVAWWDCSVGAAGDMLLAALLDAGASRTAVERGLRGLDLGDWTLELEEVTRSSLRGLLVRFAVVSPDHPHVHRSWQTVRSVLEGASLPDRARVRALNTYRRLAEAEAQLHCVPVDEVELHEVGATDAILDITGVCLALEDLGIDEVSATALPAGGGHVQSAHGRLPLPAPATLKLLLDWPMTPGPGPGEWVTPTGAALVSSLAKSASFPEMIPERIGHGAGTRDPEHVPNLVRVVVGRSADQPALEEVMELACNVDDLSGELVPPLLARLLDEGALDAWATPVHMKKGRPGLLLQALVRPADADRMCEVLLRHSSTLGVRRHVAQRRILERWVDRVHTPYGPVRIKVGGREGVAWHAAPEFDDVAERARTADVSLQDVYTAALAAWHIQ